MAIYIVPHLKRFRALQYRKHGTVSFLLLLSNLRRPHLILPTLMDVKVFVSFAITINTVMKVLVHSSLCTCVSVSI